MRSRIPLLTFLLVAGLLALPAITQAAAIPFFGPIIPQEGTQAVCAAGWGMLITVINNIIAFSITIAIVFIAPLMVAYAGFLFVVNPVNSGGISKAKGILTNTIVGIVIALAGWMIVDAIMVVLYNPGAVSGTTRLGAWSQLITSGGLGPCVDLRGSVPPTVAPPTVGVGVPGCSTCVSLTGRGLTCNTASSCTLVPSVADRLVTLKSNFSGTWTITEAFPPTVTHSNPCHANGTCIDAGFRGSTAYTATNIAEFATDARSAGLRPVFETVSCSLRDQARSQGVTAYCKTDSGYSHITGNHFSVYAN